MAEETFDFIIAGGGSAGCVLANRLSEDPKNSVCLLEAGGSDKSPLITVPLGIMFLIDHKIYNWRYRTAEQTDAGKRQIKIPRGKALGGSSTINGMIYARGNPLDYDDWESKAGCTGWSYKDVLPYFKKSETNEQLGDDPYHGNDGPLYVSDLKKPNKLVNVFFEATDALQLPRCADFNGKDQIGAGFRQLTVKNGRRVSASKAFLDPVKQRSNLTVFTETYVDKVNLDNGKATGVDVVQNGERKTIKANREVILSCGSVVSPLVLMRSGIGDPAELSQHGIGVNHALEGVGKNLQDHVSCNVIVKSPSMASYGISIRALPKLALCLADYLINGTGMIASNMNEGAGFIKSKPELDRPDIQFGFTPAVRSPSGRKLSYGHGYSMNTAVLHPKSRGTVSLNNADPMAPPKIDPRFFSDADDLDTLVYAVQFVRKILGSPAFDKYHGVEIKPGDDIKTDDELAEFIRNNSATIYHPVGTCAMGSGDDAVVDPALRVKGLQGLRVVDASVMPILIGGNTNAPVIMIAEKAADLILGKPTLPAAELPI